MKVSLGSSPINHMGGEVSEGVVVQYILQLRRLLSRFGQEEGEVFRLYCRSIQDDESMYRDVVMEWNEQHTGADALASWLEEHLPTNWDDEVIWDVKVDDPG